MSIKSRWTSFKFSKVNNVSSTRFSTCVIHIPTANVLRFGDPPSAQPVLRGLSWTVQHNETWAVMSPVSGAKSAMFEVLLGRLRIVPHPSPPGIFPSFPSDKHEPNQVSLVSFQHRTLPSGSFYDYSARYGAPRDEDKVTLRQSLFPETMPRPKLPREIEDLHLVDLQYPPPHYQNRSQQDMDLFERLIRQVDLEHLLDIPQIALSNGQTRRARIVRAILKHPKLLLLDEPLTGLDASHRPAILDLLHSIQQDSSTRIILGMRTQDPIPDWISHIAFVQGGKVAAGPKNEVLETHAKHFIHSSKDNLIPALPSGPSSGKLLADLLNVSVRYEDRSVLHNICWQIREGERWHLQGANGSGKTTLLALLTGDHPQSYTQRGDNQHLQILGKPRSALPTPYIQSQIGFVSPELFDAFPRRSMTVWEVIGTGFDGGFVSKGHEGVGIGIGFDKAELTQDDIRWRMIRCEEVLERLGPEAWLKTWKASSNANEDTTPNYLSPTTKEFKDRVFASLSIGEQRMVLLMRALVGHPPLVFLDEVWSGMDETMIETAREYLRSRDAFTPRQAVVVISHWEDEVPWNKREGLKQFSLTDRSHGV